MNAITPSKFKAKNISVGSPVKKKNGTFLSVSYGKESVFYVNAGFELKVPFGADYYPDSRKEGGGKWNVKVALPTDCPRAFAFCDLENCYILSVLFLFSCC
eukprot:SAG31_NODE_1972_length_6762_cov_16.244635_4_plen_101_part_00